MTVYLCKVWDSDLGEWIDRGVFSTAAKALTSGWQYIADVCDSAQLIDWEFENNASTDWYQGANGHFYTRVVTQTEIDRSL